MIPYNTAVHNSLEWPHVSHFQATVHTGNPCVTRGLFDVYGVAFLI